MHPHRSRCTRTKHLDNRTEIPYLYIGWDLEHMVENLLWRVAIFCFDFFFFLCAFKCIFKCVFCVKWFGDFQLKDSLASTYIYMGVSHRWQRNTRDNDATQWNTLAPQMAILVRLPESKVFRLWPTCQYSKRNFFFFLFFFVGLC